MLCLKILNSITSAKSLLPWAVTYSQVSEMKMQTSHRQLFCLAKYHSQQIMPNNHHVFIWSLVLLQDFDKTTFSNLPWILLGSRLSGSLTSSQADSRCLAERSIHSRAAWLSQVLAAPVFQPTSSPHLQTGGLQQVPAPIPSIEDYVLPQRVKCDEMGRESALKFNFSFVMRVNALAFLFDFIVAPSTLQNSLFKKQISFANLNPFY